MSTSLRRDLPSLENILLEALNGIDNPPPILPPNKFPEEETQLGRVDRLCALIESGEELSPFHQIPGFLNKIIESFQRFIRWILGNPPLFPMDALQLRYAMEIFNTFDERLFPIGHPLSQTQKRLPFSFVLNTWITFLSKQEQNEEITGSIRELKTLYGYQKNIEEIHSSPWEWRRKQLFNQMVSRLTKEIDNLKEGESVSFPGGYITSIFDSNRKLQDFNQAKNVVTSRPSFDDKENMLYRVTKRSNNNVVFEVRTLSNNKESTENNQNFGKVNFIKESDPIDSQEFIKGLPVLIDAQLKAFEIKNPEKKAVDLIKTRQGIDEIVGEIRGSLASAKVKEIFKNFNLRDRSNKENSIQAKSKQLPTDKKMMDLFFRIKGKNDAFVKRTGMEISLLLWIAKNCQKELQGNEVYRQWMRANVNSILGRLKRHFGNTEQVQEKLKPLIETLTNIVKNIQETAVAAKKEIIPPSQKNVDRTFSDPIVIENIPFPAETSTPSEKSIPSKITVFVPPTYFESEETAFNHMLEIKKKITQLSDKEKIGELRQLVNQAYAALENADKKNIFAEIESNQLEEWTAFVNLLARCSLQVQLGTNQKAPTPAAIYHSLFGIYIAQVLIKKNPANKFDQFCIDTTHYHDILRYPHLDLGVYGPRIKELLTKIRGAPDLKPVDLTNVIPEKPKACLEACIDGTPNEYKYYYQFKESSRQGVVQRNQLRDEVHNQISTISQHFDQKGPLPPQIVLFRQMRVVSMVMMDRYRVIHCKGLFDKVKRNFNALISTLRWAVNRQKNCSGDKFDKKMLVFSTNNLKELIDSLLRSRKAPSNFVIKSHIPLVQPTLYIGSLGIHYHSRSEGHFVISAYNDNTELSSPYDAPLDKKKSTKRINNYLTKGGIADQVTEGESKSISRRPVGEDGKGVLSKNKHILEEDVTHRKNHAWMVSGDYGREQEVERRGYAKELENQSVYVATYYPTGVVEGEHLINRSDVHLPGQSIDVFREMRLSLTDPESDRIEKTVAFFDRHLTMLQDKDYQIHWKQFLRLNLFRNASLYLHLCKKPTYSNVLLKKLREWSNSPVLNIETQLFLMDLKYEILDAMKKANQKVAHEVLDESIRFLELEVTKDFEKIKGWREQLKVGASPELEPNRQVIHQTFLHQHFYRAVDDFDSPMEKEQLWAIQESYFIFKNSALSDSQSTLSEMMISTLYQRLLPQFIEYMKDEKQKIPFLQALITITLWLGRAHILVTPRVQFKSI